MGTELADLYDTIRKGKGEKITIRPGLGTSKVITYAGTAPVTDKLELIYRANRSRKGSKLVSEFLSLTNILEVPGPGHDVHIIANSKEDFESKVQELYGAIDGVVKTLKGAA